MSSKKDSLVNFYSEEEQAKLLTFRSADKLKIRPVAKPVIKAPVVVEKAALMFRTIVSLLEGLFILVQKIGFV